MRYWEKDCSLFRGEGRISEVYHGAGTWAEFPKHLVDHVHSQADELDEAGAKKWMAVIDRDEAARTDKPATDKPAG